jgi:hypothetical protein
MISELSGFYQALHNINVHQTILRRIANQISRIFASNGRFNDVLPQLSDLNHPAIGVAEMFARTIGDRPPG